MSNELKPCPFCGSDGKEENGFSPCESIMYAFCSNVNCYLHNIDVGMNAEAWNKRSQQSAPAGYVMVPVEPTDAMKRAGNDALAQHWGAGDAYRAMLAASRLPVQPVQGMSNRSKRLDEIRAEAERFFEWPGDDRSTVTLTSCILFADHIAAPSEPAAQDELAKLRERVAELELELSSRLMDAEELAALRAQEPVATVGVEPDYWSGGHFHEGKRSYIDPFKVRGLPIGTKLYASPAPAPAPAPAQPAEKLVEALESATEWLEHSDNTHGYCCCGMRMDTHETPMNAGHVPVDAGEYHSGILIAQCREALAAYRAAQGEK